MSPREYRLRTRIDQIYDELARTRRLAEERRVRLKRANEKLRNTRTSRDHWKAKARGN